MSAERERRPATSGVDREPGGGAAAPAEQRGSRRCSTIVTMATVQVTVEPKNVLATSTMPGSVMLMLPCAAEHAEQGALPDEQAGQGDEERRHPEPRHPEPVQRADRARRPASAAAIDDAARRRRAGC